MHQSSLLAASARGSAGSESRERRRHPGTRKGLLALATALGIVAGVGIGPAFSAPTDPQSSGNEATSVESAPATEAASTAGPASTSAPAEVGSSTAKATDAVPPAPLQSATPSQVPPKQTEEQQPTLEPASSGPGARMGQGLMSQPKVAGEQPSKLLSRSLLATASSIPAGVPGMDVSGWQADSATHSISQVNWAQQWNLGARFSYMKASEGAQMADASRTSHLTGAKSVGMITGAYHFALPNASSAAVQADWFVKNGGGWKANSATLPPLLDIENNPYGSSCYGMSQSAMVAWIKAFSSRMQTLTGRLPAIYTNYYWWQDCTGNSKDFANQPLHIAAYGTSSPWIPGGWSQYSFWQFSDSAPFAGDSNVWNGTLATLQRFAATAGGAVPTNPSISTAADLVVADSAGTLWNYPANGKGGFGSRKQIGNSWTGMRSITVIDWNSDGTLDLLAQRTSGALSYYRGLPGGGFATPLVLASSGWGTSHLTVGYWLNASPYPQILSRGTDSSVTLWESNAGTSLKSSKSIGSGWGSLNMTMLDFDGDGKQDILAQDASGSVRLFRSNGSGNFLSETRPVVATGWNKLTSISVSSDFTAAGSLGLIQRSATGQLNYVAVTGRSSFGATTSIGSGWSSYLIAGGENINMIQVPAAPGAPLATAANASLKAQVSASTSATSVLVTATPGGANCTISSSQGTCTITGLINGTSYSVKAVARNSAGISVASPASNTVIPKAPVQRIYGVDRFETSALVSRSVFAPGVPVVYLTNGRTFPDALSGAAAAGKQKGPVLLSNTAGMPASITSELSRLKPAKIVLLGGTGALSSAVEKAARNYANSVVRIGGADRYDVAAAVSQLNFPAGVGVAYIASGTEFPDALAGAAAAASQGGPVLLSSPAGLTAKSKIELKRLNPKRIVVLGGTGAVPATVETQLRSYAPTVVRYSGNDRYATSAAISAGTFAPGVSNVYIVDGTGFPDALSTAAAAGALKGPVLLTTSQQLTNSVESELSRLKPAKVIVVGGPTAVTEGLRASLQNYAKY